MNVKVPSELVKAQKWANLFDTAFQFPIIPMRIGLDAIIGLIPGAGDVLMLLVSLRIVLLGRSLGMPKVLIVQMIKHVVIDFALGFIPLIGDIADIFYKANQKNVRLMERWWLSQNKANVDRATQYMLDKWVAQQDAQ